MRNSKRIQTTNIGIVSLIMVIIIVSITIMTLLSLSEAVRDREYSDKLAKHSTEYFEASNIAQEQLAAISKAVDGSGISEQAEIDGVDEFSINGSRVTYSVRIGIREKLEVEVDISGGKTNVISYKEVQAKNWDGDTNLHVIPLD